MAWRIVVTNNKGGAGKSMLAAALAAALARLGFDVVAADMDPQGNLTRRMGYDETAWPAGRPTIAEGLRLRAQAPVPFSQVAVPCLWEHELAARIMVLPSVPKELETRQREGGLENGAVYRLRRQLDAYDGPAGFTIIDVPPGLGHLTDMALAAGDAVLIVLQPEYDYVQGAVRMVDYVETERDALARPDLHVVGVVVTNVQDTSTHRAQLANLPALFADGIVWQPAIPHRATWSAATSDARPIELVKGWQAAELARMFDSHARQLCTALGVEHPAVPTAPVVGNDPVTNVPLCKHGDDAAACQLDHHMMVPRQPTAPAQVHP
jgi:cellulose biosynthesis protein BcsQ